MLSRVSIFERVLIAIISVLMLFLIGLQYGLYNPEGFGGLMDFAEAGRLEGTRIEYPQTADPAGGDMITGTVILKVKRSGLPHQGAVLINGTRRQDFRNFLCKVDVREGDYVEILGGMWDGEVDVEVVGLAGLKEPRIGTRYQVGDENVYIGRLVFK